MGIKNTWRLYAVRNRLRVAMDIAKTKLSDGTDYVVNKICERIIRQAKTRQTLIWWDDVSNIIANQFRLKLRDNANPSVDKACVWLQDYCRKQISIHNRRRLLLASG